MWDRVAREGKKVVKFVLEDSWPWASQARDRSHVYRMTKQCMHAAGEVEEERNAMERQYGGSGADARDKGGGRQSREKFWGKKGVLA